MKRSLPGIVRGVLAVALLLSGCGGGTQSDALNVTDPGDDLRQYQAPTSLDQSDGPRIPTFELRQEFLATGSVGRNVLAAIVSEGVMPGAKINVYGTGPNDVLASDRKPTQTILLPNGLESLSAAARAVVMRDMPAVAARVGARPAVLYYFAQGGALKTNVYVFSWDEPAPVGSGTGGLIKVGGGGETESCDPLSGVGCL